jgi:hypothetical protein
MAINQREWAMYAAGEAREAGRVLAAEGWAKHAGEWERAPETVSLTFARGGALPVAVRVRVRAHGVSLLRVLPEGWRVQYHGQARAQGEARVRAAGGNGVTLVWRWSEYDREWKFSHRV